MNLMNTLEFNKISKYVIRLRKSVIKNDINKISEYYDHLKYHIQLGGDSENIKELQSKFDSIDKVINNLKTQPGTKYLYSGVSSDLETCNKDKIDLETKLASAKDELEKLKSQLLSKTNELDGVNKLKEAKTEEEKKINEELALLKETNEKLNSQIKELTSQSELSKEKIISAENTLEKVFGLYEIIGDSIETKMDTLKDKINNYKEMIKKINDEAANNKLTGTNELEKFESAIRALKEKSDNAIEIEQKLEKLQESLLATQKEKNDLAIELNELKTKTSETQTLASQLEEKEKQITELKARNETLEKENKAMIDDKEKINEQLTSVASTFDSKLRALLETIYGSNEIVSELMNGTKIAERTV